MQGKSEGITLAMMPRWFYGEMLSRPRKTYEVNTRFRVRAPSEAEAIEAIYTVTPTDVATREVEWPFPSPYPWGPLLAACGRDLSRLGGFENALCYRSKAPNMERYPYSDGVGEHCPPGSLWVKSQETVLLAKNFRASTAEDWGTDFLWRQGTGLSMLLGEVEVPLFGYHRVDTWHVQARDPGNGMDLRLVFAPAFGLVLRLEDFLLFDPLVAEWKMGTHYRKDPERLIGHYLALGFSRMGTLLCVLTAETWDISWKDVSLEEQALFEEVREKNRKVALELVPGQVDL